MVTLFEIRDRINDLLSGNDPEATVRDVVTHVRDKLAERQTLKQQVQPIYSQFSTFPRSPQRVRTGVREAV